MKGSDNYPVTQKKKKTQQHQALVNALTQWSYDVHLRPLPLGFAGTVYKSNLETLVDLGITRHQSLSVFFFFFFFFLGGRDIHYKDAMKETTSVCEGHPQQKLQATRTT